MTCVEGDIKESPGLLLCHKIFNWCGVFKQLKYIKQYAFNVQYLTVNYMIIALMTQLCAAVRVDKCHSEKTQNKDKTNIIKPFLQGQIHKYHRLRQTQNKILNITAFVCPRVLVSHSCLGKNRKGIAVCLLRLSGCRHEDGEDT